ncbi:MAG: citrate synthase [Sinobacteraceae bacterium]|nr:citrate synthase [Nevskiaceae bacterium]MBV8852211.1 citrate synthase [Nevskiaceae bacterium]MBV9911307.1 citrate synthase [Nevskiaceae bacterium]
MTEKSFELVDQATQHKSELPLRSGSVGPDVVDLTSLYKDLGVFTYDPGFGLTAACDSKITYIDGDAGVLLYRGYPVEQLAEKSSFMEVAYLLLLGELPNPKQLEEFTCNIRYHTMINETLLRFFNGFHHNAHPMAMVSAVVASMSAFYHDTMDIHNPRHREIFSHRIIAKIPTIAAAAHKHSLGQPFMYPRNDLDYCSNLLHMLFAVPCESYEVDPVAAEALDLLFILHADHEQNASTSTVRLAGSTGANPYAAISAGVSALWGPAHGGANEAVLAMLEQIGTVDNIPKYLAMAKDKSSHFRLMGFGHRVYKNFDPRAQIIRAMCHKVLARLGRSDNPLFELALRLEEIALKDDYFVSRKLYPNVDFYSGMIYSAIGIPRSMFTVMFAIARTVGWVAHWQEMISDPTMRIGRPRQLYTGAKRRDYVDISKRSDRSLDTRAHM